MERESQRARHRPHVKLKGLFSQGSRSSSSSSPSPLYFSSVNSYDLCNVPAREAGPSLRKGTVSTAVSSEPQGQRCGARSPHPGCWLSYCTMLPRNKGLMRSRLWVHSLLRSSPSSSCLHRMNHNTVSIPRVQIRAYMPGTLPPEQDDSVS